ncbi:MULTISPECIES: DNA (cytosine-5-)-methyltransferase [unclassified Janthinobacterium]|uniref:DNA (cytosine-5-)-methyltransferase n=1 Tax=unclassified Janthinobacterium TaxID=2610881 RepID=UPI0008883CD2|nr:MULTISPECIES: DNA (cytosine-5-)-methyltransferase [unclassified Janthinobacterium]SDA75493.1 DNA (cytosine-5)-methyltransferase 1 [Janthinobacterium sp. 551a]SFB57350.1 DNA (cytosine-5)-methyltransferase 1 [Janthinobacterium sp. 344]
MEHKSEDLALLSQVLESYDLKRVAEELNQISPGTWSRDSLKLLMSGKTDQALSEAEFLQLRSLLPQPPSRRKPAEFDFIDLFAGIGGIRRGFEDAGGRCVFTSEWNPYAVRTYKANHYSDPAYHKFNADIREVTLSDKEDVSEGEAYRHIDLEIPDHDVLLAGFPCQPFSIAGVSKKNSLGRKHGFECDTQGTLFFDVARIIAAKRPVAFVLENVKNLKSHDKGNTFRVIMKALDELGYSVADADSMGTDDPKIIDGSHFVPQHRERIVLVGFRRDLDVHSGFTLRDVARHYPERRPALGDILDAKYDEKYVLTPKLWEYLFNYSIKHKAKGNGFGYGLVRPHDITRTLSARYYKDGSEILIDRGFDPELDFNHPLNQKNRPRRLTPRECARLMGYDAPGESAFRMPASDMQTYKQFGNSVVVPVFRAVAMLMKDRVIKGKVAAEKLKSGRLAA